MSTPPLKVSRPLRDSAALNERSERRLLTASPSPREGLGWGNVGAYLVLVAKKAADEAAFEAERTRFELVVQNNPYGSLANCWFQPLTHLSGIIVRNSRQKLTGLQRYHFFVN